MSSVRSLASVSLRKQQDKGLRFGFDFFAVDFEEEFSAFYGRLLYDQTRFLELVVKTVLELYRGKRHDVVLVGHSMVRRQKERSTSLPKDDLCE